MKAAASPHTALPRSFPLPPGGTDCCLPRLCVCMLALEFGGCVLSICSCLGGEEGEGGRRDHTIIYGNV